MNCIHFYWFTMLHSLHTKKIAVALIAAMTVFFTGCGLLDSDSNDPNQKLGGNTKLDYTNVGDKFSASIDIIPYPLNEHINDSITVTKNENGDVTILVHYTFDTTLVRGLDTLLGTQDFSEELRASIRNYYINKYEISVDTSNPDNIRVWKEIKLRATSDGIQEYVSSKGNTSKPFTVIRYNANVGDKYEFTNAEGEKLLRTVVYHSTTDDYEMAFWRIKVFKTEEYMQNDPMISKITYITNHKFGLVAIEIDTKDGKHVPVTIWPPNF